MSKPLCSPTGPFPLVWALVSGGLYSRLHRFRSEHSLNDGLQGYLLAKMCLERLPSASKFIFCKSTSRAVRVVLQPEPMLMGSEATTACQQLASRVATQRRVSPSSHRWLWICARSSATHWIYIMLETKHRLISYNVRYHYCSFQPDRSEYSSM